MHVASQEFFERCVFVQLLIPFFQPWLNTVDVCFQQKGKLCTSLKKRPDAARVARPDAARGAPAILTVWLLSEVYPGEYARD